MGMGDVKLAPGDRRRAGVAGLRFVGVAAAAAVLFGGVGGIVALIVGRDRKAMIPFGPYMAAGAVVAAFWGEPIADWYLRRWAPPSFRAGPSGTLEHTYGNIVHADV